MRDCAASRGMDCAMRLRRRSAGGVRLGFPLGRGDVPRVDEVPICWGKEKEIGVGEVG